MVQLRNVFLFVVEVLMIFYGISFSVSTEIYTTQEIDENQFYLNYDKTNTWQPGHADIGVLLAITRYDSASKTCGIVREFTGVVHAMAVSFAFEAFNAYLELVCQDFNVSVIKLGYVILDACDLDGAAAKHATKFVPRTLCVSRTSNVGSCSIHNNTTSFDIVGIIGPQFTPQLLAVHSILEFYQIPIVSFLSANENLIEITNAFTVQPPNTYKFSAIALFIKRFNWSYVSVVYSGNTYGETGFRAFKSSAQKICIAGSFRISTMPAENADVQTTAQALAKSEARVVLMIVDTISTVKMMIEATGNYVSPGHIVWIGDNTWDNLTEFQSIEHHVYGSFFASARPITPSDEIRNYEAIRQRNPWFDKYKQRLDYCKSKGLNNTRTCPRYELFNKDIITSTNNIIDAVAVYFVVILSKIVRKELLCPEGPQKCITRYLFLDVLLRSTQYSDPQFKSYVDVHDILVMGDNVTWRNNSYSVRQIIEKNGNLSSNIIQDYNEDWQSQFNVTWEYHNHTVPHSRCHDERDCRVDEILVPQTPECCLQCTRCGPREIPHTSRQRCIKCPAFSWNPTTSKAPWCAPMPDVGLYCIYFSACDYDKHKSWTISILLVAVLGLVACALTTVCYVHFQTTDVIKSSSIELSFLMLLGITVGYGVMLLVTVKPSEAKCVLEYLLFFTSFSLVYGAMLIRAVRIYRIFRSGRTTRLTMIRSKSQVAFVLLIVLGQLLSCIIFVASKEFSFWYVKVPHESGALNTCRIVATGILIAGFYTLVLSLLCVFLAYKTRDLPDRFNEARWMISCVGTTLITTVIFIPAYPKEDTHETTGELILCLVLAVNHTFTLIFLFFHKLWDILSGRSKSTWTRRTTRVSVT